MRRLARRRDSDTAEWVLDEARRAGLARRYRSL